MTTCEAAKPRALGWHVTLSIGSMRLVMPRKSRENIPQASTAFGAEAAAQPSAAGLVSGGGVLYLALYRIVMNPPRRSPWHTRRPRPRAPSLARACQVSRSQLTKC